MGSCSSWPISTYQNIINQYPYWHEILTQPEQQQLQQLLKLKTVKLSRCKSTIKYPIIHGDWQKQKDQSMTLRASSPYSQRIGSGIIIFQQHRNSQTEEVLMYFGCVKQGKIHQQGVAIYQNNIAYSGKLRLKKDTYRQIIYDGQGKLYNQNGELAAEGMWKNHKLQYGNLITSSGEKIIVKNHTYEVEYPSEATYIGQGIVTDEYQFIRHGIGKFTSADKHYQYRGSWNHNKKHGIGQAKYFQNDGTIQTYKGSYENDFKYGEGQYIMDNCKFKGQWKGQDKYKGILMKNGKEKQIKINWNQ